MTRATSSYPVVLLLLLAVVVVAGACNGCSAMPSSSQSMNLCTYYEKHPTDKCLPGGKWDPLSNACTGSSPGESCYSCYSGPWCDTYNNSTQACTAVLQGGNPLLFQEYWEQAAMDGCTSVPASFKSGYQNMGNFAPAEAVETVIRALHAAVGNANTTGREIVLGFGSTQVMASALYAKAVQLGSSGSKAQALVQRPYYMHYSYQVNTTATQDKDGSWDLSLQWNTTADPANPSTVEIVTRPNNPNGDLRQPMVQDDSRVLYDLAYNWPQFTSSCNQTLDHDTMIFTASKMSGHAGSRFGWALVKDPEQAELMRAYISTQTLGLDISSQMRVATVMQSLAAAGPRGGMFAFATKTMEARWARIHSILNSEGAKAKGFVLKNACKDGRCGAYAWIQCPESLTSPCIDLFAAAGVLGLPGSIFGSTDDHIRFELIGRSVEFAIGADRMEAVMNAPSLDAVLASGGQAGALERVHSGASSFRHRSAAALGC